MDSHHNQPERRRAESHTAATGGIVVSVTGRDEGEGNDDGCVLMKAIRRWIMNT